MNLPSIPNQPGANQLSTEVRREVVSATVKELVETGLISVEQQKGLTVAAQGLGIMKSVSVHSSKRHFGRISTELSIRQATPVGEARICLESMQEAWDGVNKTFLLHRERFLEIKVLRAKLTKRCREAEAMEPGDDKTIAMAECELEQSRIDRMQKEVMEGTIEVKSQVERATRYSEQYKLICSAAGKTEFTEADFRADEMMYYIKSALWHSAQTFSTDDQRDSYERMSEDETAPQNASIGRRKQVDWDNQIRARKNMQIVIPHDAKLALVVMGLTEAEVKEDLKRLEEQRFNFNLTHKSHHSFADHFDSWLNNTALKYKDRVASTLAGNMDKFQRVQQLLKADASDQGASKGDVNTINRRSSIQ